MHVFERDKAAGYLELQNADVQWFLSIDGNDLPELVRGGQSTYRSIAVDGEEVEFSDGFGNLHTRVYQETLAGRGFGIAAARPSIELVHGLRHAPATRPSADHGHPLIGGGIAGGAG